MRHSPASLVASILLIANIAQAATARPMRQIVGALPTTLDIHEADSMAAMLIDGNVFAPLVASTMKGGPQGLIAESWTTDSAGKTWTFTIRKGLRFEDGSPITPQAVILNFQRMLWLTRGQGLALNSLLSGSKDVRRLGDPVPGLRVEGDTVVFAFDRRPDHLFEEINEAIYGIADPKCFDDEGRWKEPFCPGASGQYRVESRTPGSFTLRSRGVYPAVKGAPESVEVFVSTSGRSVAEELVAGLGDMAYANPFDLSAETRAGLAQRGIGFAEGPANIIHFVELNARRAPFLRRETRRAVRDEFLALLARDPAFTRQFAVDPSFLPKIADGWKEFPVAAPRGPRAAPTVPVDVLLTKPARLPKDPRDRAAVEAVERALLEALRRNGFAPNLLRPAGGEWWKRLSGGDFDVAIRGTDLIVQDPFADLRLMFLSRVGALIPDPSGTVPALIEKAENAADRSESLAAMEGLNQAVYDDATVVDFAHYGDGYLHARGVDLSAVNNAVETLEFRTVAWTP